MQPILDGPRAGLTVLDVTALLQSQSAIKIAYGAEVFDDEFNGVGDIQAFMVEGSTISSDITATIQRTCSLNIQGDVASMGWNYLGGYIRPYQTFTDMLTGATATFRLGMYTLTTPTNDLSTDPPINTFSGYDLVYILQNPIGDSYEIPAGSDPAQAAADAIGLAIPGVTVDITPSGETFQTQQTFPFDPSQPLTWLDVVNACTTAIGYRNVWVDWNGTFQIEPFIDAQTVDPEWIFDLTADNNIVAEQRSQDQDIFDVPNWWRFVMANLTASPVEGVTQLTYEDNSATNPGSTVNRKRYVKKIVSVSATTFEQLQNFAQTTVQADLKASETFTITAQPMPLFWHMDVLEYIDPNLGSALPFYPDGKRKVLCVRWTLPLDGMSDMSMTWQTVNDQTVLIGSSYTT